MMSNKRQYLHSIKKLQYNLKCLKKFKQYHYFDEYLDETYDEAIIGPFVFKPSRILKELDMKAYNCAYNDWLEGEVRDYKLLIEAMKKIMKEDEGK